MSYRSAKDYKDEQSHTTKANASKLRRLAVSLTSRVFWQLLGYKSHEAKQPTTDAEVFSGIGFYARPLTTDKAEAILASIGDARHSVIIATRNEDVRKQIAQLEPDETAIFTSLSTVVIKADGTIEIRSKDGTALPLPTLADVQEVVDKLNALITAYKIHVHGGVTTGAGLSAVPTVVTAANADDPEGTDVIRAE
jgi:phage gp45-like